MPSDPDEHEEPDIEMRAIAALTVLSVLVLAGCSSEGPRGLVDKVKDTGTLVVGVRTDAPGLGLLKGEEYTGFDVEVARYVGARLGAGKVEFRRATADRAVAALDRGEVDVVIAAYPISDEHKQRVSFAGPYLAGGQGILIRSSEKRVKGLDSLRKRKVCGAASSASSLAIAARFGGTQDIANAWGRDHLKIFNSYAECLEELGAGRVDAVSTDTAVLAGLAAPDGGRFTIVDSGLGTAKYGVALRKDDSPGRSAINDALAAMVTDGSWQRAVSGNFGTFDGLFTAPALERY
ncbi:glutamate ABC transporter substrate-binding protein [Actinocorallia lasiicapitis]